MNEFVFAVLLSVGEIYFKVEQKFVKFFSKKVKQVDYRVL